MSLRILRQLAALLGLTISASALGSVEIGQAAPEFNLQDQSGDWHTLERHRGKWVALYFYPKDDTPGCTKEACAFRDNIFSFDELNAVVLGVSLDDVESHEAFAEKYSLPFSILADVEKEAATSYGVLMKIGAHDTCQTTIVFNKPRRRYRKTLRKSRSGNTHGRSINRFTGGNRNDICGDRVVELSISFFAFCGRKERISAKHEPQHYPRYCCAKSAAGNAGVRALPGGSLE